MTKNITLIEEILNIKFPTVYVQFVLNIYDLENKKFKFAMDDGGYKSNEVITFLNFEEQSDDYIVNVCKEEEHLQPNHLIPFARTEWEYDFICFYFENGRNQEPKIIYFSFDLYYESLEDSIFHIANSFDEFVHKLDEE
ncbi:hypothetical protein BIV60_12230 [Bacillus sp. MUM 116]|uniref:SMI1/KNR4 family protein n=1 Tax=Bacillus sp. MUM 116 TaxID=1678002 RepID=UPI0008F5CCD8|nr:SMI1/KNR4 family protein [Bacillus sp. MUM 116]OIK14266.1 hypothetical protein BIV60_12230 [Bacillus sp. MUM 116]